MRVELCDRRVLGAVRCVDGVTGLPINAPLLVTAPGLTLRPGPRGLVVIHGAPGLPALGEISTAFAEQPPTLPKGQTWRVTLTIGDPSGRYLPRQATIQLPRAAGPKDPDSVFTPLTLALYPSPAAPIAEGWAVVRATVVAEKPGGAKRRLPWAWLRVVPSGNELPTSPPLAHALADGRGEALIAVRALPLSFGEAGTRRADLPAVIEVVFDSHLQDLPLDLTGPERPGANDGYLPNPSTLEGQDKHLRDGTFQGLTLVAGREQTAVLEVQLTERPP